MFKEKRNKPKRFDNLFHFKADNDQVAEIRELIKEFHNKIKKEQDAKKSNELIKYIENNDEKLIDEIFQKFNLSTDLFKYIVADTLFSKIVNAENQTIETITELLGSRYTSTNIGEYLYNDKALLKDLETFTE
ncbi:hypothetical protein BXU11_17090 [Flavobacterium sp. LM5]|uniref:hypothetical protein n=1 Tax=Flavobacterium sp. LM5 TaxID=1938610 RepID=UPI0009936F51|nr:hypothetical protein [Flavobacterium sp. LM5]OOV21029.1 hypothetical protein BXU11_17090 [Flavobacterium sp. LM5]